MTEALYPIQMAARLTGLSTHVIRIWEQRYKAVKPGRTGSRQRRYTREHLDRLALLRDATKAGHSIGQVARLPLNRLRELVGEAGTRSGTPLAAFTDEAAHAASDPSWVGVSTPDGRASTTPPAVANLLPRIPPPTASATDLIEAALAAVRSFDTPALDDVLRRGMADLGTMGWLRDLVAPLAVALGDRWRAGSLTAAHEHFATARIRVLLGNASRPFGPLDGAPVLLVSTPAGQLHELGALLAATLASHLGWKVTYLGASLPAAEIAGAARVSGARAVAVSLVFPEDDPRLITELEELRRQLPGEIPLLAGGRAVRGLRPVLERLDYEPIETLDGLGECLDRLRTGAGRDLRLRRRGGQSRP